ncbi:uncharacterized protein STEHIDRAFT_90828 [Stereum hirsutum FP-91666 SS1]|uniref:uncharacterized protein n=1 Tax=Stereum hirsutum (strain FP-91666) TaxID=721885 RepID=UPI000440A33E|nr:uncharacterized protein STEHIDRAFT_90828 [Stereum hirsutum FP-91666 SS1]EIM90911.1 hypothetical protein STEHIDRAFT_90828 [Stereum hirsutum FP-91666 SS1]
MMPLVKLHDMTTRDLAHRIGGSRTGLLNASMSNIVEIVIAATALRKCELSVVQSTLIGSMLSKLLLVLGLCFFAGGLRFTEQAFDASATQVHSSLLSISVGAVLLPAAYHFSISGGSNTASFEQRLDILQMSHGVAIILLVIYVAYLFFQLYTHRNYFKDKEEKSKHHDLQAPDLKPLKSLYMASRSTLNIAAYAGKDRSKTPAQRFPNSPGSSSSRDSSPEGPKSSRNRMHKSETNSPYAFGHSRSYILNSPEASASDISLPLTNGSTSQFIDHGRRETSPSPTSAGSSSMRYVYSKGGATPAPEHGTTAAERYVGPDGVVPKQPKLAWPLTLGLLITVTVLVAVNAEWLVEAMDGLNPMISKQWIGLILLPAISSIAECATAMNVSVKDQLTLSVSVAIGSTIQTALFVTPLMIVLGWAMSKPLALLFDPFQSVVLYISVHTMGYVVADGKSNWLEGAILICLYVVIAVCFWFYPGSTFSYTLASCASAP